VTGEGDRHGFDSIGETWPCYEAVSRANKSLPLFEEVAPSRDEALAIVARVPPGSRFTQEMSKCSGGRPCCKDGPSHGPYWFAHTPRKNGKRGKRVYVGPERKKHRIELAWEVYAAALAELEATPEGRRLRELEALAGRPRLARTSEVLDQVPITSFGGGRTRVPK
jgi:hypothetical protein